MDPYHKFIQSEYANLRFLSFVPKKIYEEQPDFRLGSSVFVKQGKAAEQNEQNAIVPFIKAPKENGKGVIYRPYNEEVRLLTTQLPPLLPQIYKPKEKHVNSKQEAPTFYRDLSPLQIEQENISQLSESEKKIQSGSVDSFALIPEGNQYKERTVNSATYPTDVKKHYINIDTKFRNKPELTTSTNFRWRLFRPIKNCISLRVASVEIPNNFYTFSAAKENVAFSAKLTVSPSYTSLTIPDGNYTSAYLESTLQTQLQTIDANFTVSISNITGKISIQNLTNNFDIIFPKNNTATTFDWGLGYYLGFNNISYTNKSSITSERILNIVGDNYIMLQIGDYEGIEHEVEKQGLITATAKIILTSDKYTIIFDNGSNFISKEVLFQLPTNVSAFNVRLLDSNNKDIDLMGTNFSFTLELVEIVNARLYTNYSDNLLQNTDQPR